jgi:hypothetical protein
MTMRKETIELETLRQRIAAFDWEAIDLAEQLERGLPGGKQTKAAEERRSRLGAEVRKLTAELHELIAQSPKEAIEEWVDWHKGVLEEIIQSEPEGTANTRLGMARFVLGGWEKLLKGGQDYVRINKYFLKDYVEKIQQTFPMDELPILKDADPEEPAQKSSWKFWE